MGYTLQENIKISTQNYIHNQWKLFCMKFCLEELIIKT